MARLKKYSPGTDKRGFYIDGGRWTLQTTFRSNRFFRDSIKYHPDNQVPKTVTKTLIYLGEVDTEGRKSRDQMLEWFPHLDPGYCDMDSDAVAELRAFCEEILERGALEKAEFEEFNEFLRKETPLEPFTWSGDYAP